MVYFFCQIRTASGPMEQPDLPDAGLVRDGTPCGAQLVTATINIFFRYLKQKYLFTHLKKYIFISGMCESDMYKHFPIYKYSQVPNEPQQSRMF